MPNLGSTSIYYGGGQRPAPPNVISTSGSPNNKVAGILGDIAVDSGTATAYMLVSHASGLYIWTVIGGGSSQVDTLTGNSGGAISPIGGNINIVGSGSVTVAGNPGTHTLTISAGAAGIETLTGDSGGPISPTAGNINIVNSGASLYSFVGSGSSLTLEPTPAAFPITPYVVGPNGGYATVQSAINAANAAGGGIVYVQPGSYTESLTWYTGVDVVGTGVSGDASAVTITGAHLPVVGTNSLTTIGMKNISLVSPATVFSSGATFVLDLTVENCQMSPASGDVFMDLPNVTGGLTLIDSELTSGGVVSSPCVMNVSAYNCVIANDAPGSFISGDVFIQGTTWNGATALVSPNFKIYGSSFGNVMGIDESTTGSVISGCEFTAVGLGNPCIAWYGTGQFVITDTTFNTDQIYAITGPGVGQIHASNITLVQGAIDPTININYPYSVYEGQLFIGGDTGVGVAGTFSVTNAANTTISTGVGTVNMSTVNPATNAAWIKIYIGTQSYWIPAWLTNAP